MSGVLNAFLLNGVEYSYSAVVVDLGSNIYGANGDFGSSITPATFRGATVLAVTCRPVAAGSPYDFQISIDDNLGSEPGQAWFRWLRVRDTAGNWRYYSSSSATYFFGLFSSWTWGSGSNVVWTSASTYPFVLVY